MFLLMLQKLNTASEGTTARVSLTPLIMWLRPKWRDELWWYTSTRERGATNKLDICVTKKPHHYNGKNIEETFFFVLLFLSWGSNARRVAILRGESDHGRRGNAKRCAEGRQTRGAAVLEKAEQTCGRNIMNCVTLAKMIEIITARMVENLFTR